MSSGIGFVVRRGRRGMLAVGVWLVCACNAVTGVNDLEFDAAPAPAPPARSEETQTPPVETLSALEGPCDVLTGSGCPADQTCRFSRSEAAPSCVPLSASVLARMRPASKTASVRRRTCAWRACAASCARPLLIAAGPTRVASRTRVGSSAAALAAVIW